jgi:hypothetical protein
MKRFKSKSKFGKRDLNHAFKKIIHSSRAQHCTLNLFTIKINKSSGSSFRRTNKPQIRSHVWRDNVWPDVWCISYVFIILMYSMSVAENSRFLDASWNSQSSIMHALQAYSTLKLFTHLKSRQDVYKRYKKWLANGQRGQSSLNISWKS